jgi:superfamily II DNA or RNA helicase
MQNAIFTGVREPSRIFLAYLQQKGDKMAQIYDNISLKFTKGLQDILSNVGVESADFCVGYFNLRGWDIVEKEVDKLDVCRLLIGMHKQPKEIVRTLHSKIDETPDSELVKKYVREIAINFREQLTIGFPTKKDEETLQKLCSQLKEEKLKVKLYLREPLHAKLYLAHRPTDKSNPIQALMGSSNLTYSGLTGQGELNAAFGDSDQAEKFADWFNARWKDTFSIDISENLIDVINKSWASKNKILPYYIYLKIAYHLSEETRTGMSEYEIPQEFKKELFDFQSIAVKLTIKRLNGKHNGAMIGDVVGLGKTITACTIAKMFELTNTGTTLILCPANLKKMWQKQINKYDLKAEIKSISQELDFENMKRFRLVIIDESHNLIGEGKRYHNIKKLIDYQECKVLLLTATPYNKNYRDLSAQIKLIVNEEDDLGIQPETYIKSLGGTREFSKNNPDCHIRSIKAFEKSEETSDWQELMRLFLVRRTRTFVKENYAKIDSSNGRKYLEFSDGKRSYFPDRIPKAIKFEQTPNDQLGKLYSESVFNDIGSLKLPRYGLIKYADDKETKNANKDEEQVLNNLTRAGKQIMGFCRTNFFKRLDSSGYSFFISLKKHILRNKIYIYAIENKLELPIGDEGTLPNVYEDEEENLYPLKSEQESIENYYSSLKINKQVTWIHSKFFIKTLKNDLKNDNNVLQKILDDYKNWDAKEDKKLDALEKLLKEHEHEKIIVFSQFADTVNYLAKELKSRGIKKLSEVTGNSEDPTGIAEKFSPISNETLIPQEEQFRILIATDILSEGQNLQDSHIVVNYDLPWAIIRLIQRVGRVDRIGQNSKEIFCYSFFPAEGIEKIIKLRKILNKRINENAQTLGSDEVFFDGNEQNLQDIYNEKNGILDDDNESNNDVDLASRAYQIWKSATEANPDLKDKIPKLSDAIYSTKKNPKDNLKDSVITYAKMPNGTDILTWMDFGKNIVTQNQSAILSMLSCSIDEKHLEPLENHHEIVKEAILKANEDNSNNNSGGILGSRLSTKYRLYTLLDNYCQNEKNLFITDELKNAANDIYNYPLREEAKYTLGQMLKRSNKVEYIADVVIDFRRNNKLCIKNEDDEYKKEPQIICSVGLKNG